MAERSEALYCIQGLPRHDAANDVMALQWSGRGDGLPPKLSTQGRKLRVAARRRICSLRKNWWAEYRKGKAA
jgi:hypothetical protein